MKKKLLSLLLALCLVMALVPMTAFAEGTSVDNWDGTADTSWYTDHKTDTEYHFTTAEQLAGLAQLVNDKTASVSFEGKTIYLDNDLDLSGIQWTPIGNGDNFVRHFAGTFDGQHHKVMNLYHHYTGDELVRNGLFGAVSDGGTLKNLLVIDADIASNDGSLLAGILADWVDGGTVENCYTSGKIENNVGDKMVGGLIGQCTWSTQVKGCGSDATVISTESDEDHVDTVGGLIGQWENSADSSSITDCWFGGSVSCNNIYSAVGGILGANFENFSGNKPSVIIKNCIVATKNITGAEPGNITWITAVVKPHVTDCIWPDTPPDGVTLDEETNALKKDDYKDFSGVETAVKAVVRGKNITEQSEVDKMAKAIEDAIAALEKKPASTKPRTSDKNPQTGDNSNFALWIALLLVSGGAVTATTIYGRKKKRSIK